MYYRQITYRLVTNIIPLFLIEIYILYQYIVLSKAIKKNELSSGIGKDLKDKLVMKLRLYPLILLILQLPITIVRFISITLTPSYYLFAIAGAGVSLNGFANCIVYGCTRQVKKELKNFFTKPYNLNKTEEIWFANQFNCVLLSNF